MISKEMLELLNEQITNEYYSSVLYMQMAAWCEYNNFSGFASWMKIQAQEEMDHVTIFCNFVNDSGGMVELGTIGKPPAEFSSPLDILEKAMAHEKTVTKSIHNLMENAVANKDYPTISCLDWFVREQVEEEAQFSSLVNNVKRIGDSGEGIFLFDAKMAQRIYTVPGPLAGKE